MDEEEQGKKTGTNVHIICKRKSGEASKSGAFRIFGTERRGSVRRGAGGVRRPHLREFRAFLEVILDNAGGLRQTPIEPGQRKYKGTIKPPHVIEITTDFYRRKHAIPAGKTAKNAVCSIFTISA